MMERQTLKKLSSSAIDVYRQCPRKFACSKGLVEVSPALIAAAKRQQSYAQVLGTTVHKVLESVIKAEPQERTPERIQRTIEWTAMRFGRKAGFSEPMLEQLRNETDGLVVGYLAADGAEAIPVALEKSFALRLNNGTTITTRVDRLDRRGSGEDDTTPAYEIVDYKTSARGNQLEPGDLARETAPIVQLLAVGRATGVDVERVTYLYLRAGDGPGAGTGQSESVTWWPEQEDVESATSRLLDTVRTIQTDVDFEPSPGGHCSWCPYESECPERGKKCASEREPATSDHAGWPASDATTEAA